MSRVNLNLKTPPPLTPPPASRWILPRGPSLGWVPTPSERTVSPLVLLSTRLKVLFCFFLILFSADEVLISPLSFGPFPLYNTGRIPHGKAGEETNDFLPEPAPLLTHWEKTAVSLFLLPFHDKLLSFPPPRLL